MKPDVLLVEDDPLQRAVVSALLEKRLGYRVTQAENGQEALAILQASPPDRFSVVLLDIAMPVMDGFATLSALRAFLPHLPVVMLTGNDDVHTAVRAIKAGANDFIVKPPQQAHLEVALGNAIRMHTLAREVARLTRDKEGALTFPDLIGAHTGLAEAVTYGMRASGSEVPVCITGETGTGKELFARAIHGQSRRVGGPFVAINCGAIPENLVESLLFGHEKGSFTGATHRTLGKFREADGGTLFLDEVGELPLDAQVKLLRALQQKEVEPVGASKPVPVDVRILSATNRDLRTQVQSGHFREDLYFRLNVLPIALPPLRERGHDIIKLAEHFCTRFAAADMLPAKTFSDDARAYLLQHPWPGNVRELENLMRRVLVLTDAPSITAAALAHLHDVSPPVAPTPGAISPLFFPAVASEALTLRHTDGRLKTMAELETEAMKRTLHDHGGNIAAAAQALGIAKSTFYRKLKDSP